TPPAFILSQDQTLIKKIESGQNQLLANSSRLLFKGLSFDKLKNFLNFRGCVLLFSCQGTVLSSSEDFVCCFVTACLYYYSFSFLSILFFKFFKKENGEGGI
ncbi:hypothetical protein, partial [Bilifractor porci]|uniref:hypothetical protein n=1 Tax=Bilifractor porci TaxID=2606636 RepID=UPI00197B951A